MARNVSLEGGAWRAEALLLLEGRTLCEPRGRDWRERSPWRRDWKKGKVVSLESASEGDGRLRFYGGFERDRGSLVASVEETRRGWREGAKRRRRSSALVSLE